MSGLTKRSVSLLCAAVLLLSLAISFPVGADEVSDKREELAQLKEEQKELQAAIDALDDTVESQQKKVNNLWAQVDNLEKQIDGYRDQISALDKQIAEQEKRITELNDEITVKEKEYAEVLQKLKKRLRAMEKTGNYSSLQLLLNTEKYEEYLLKAKIIECVAAHDQELMDKAEAEKAAIVQKRAEVEAQKKETEAEKAELQSAKAELDTQYSSYDKLYTSARNEQDKLEKQLGTYEKQLEQVQKAEDELDREIQALLQGTPAASTYGGKMYWPTPTATIISSPFGQRAAGNHRGVDLWAQGCLGMPIYAAADGTVIKAQRLHYSYGNFVMIDHGEDEQGRRIVTVYAHMRYAPQVSVGQKVTGGQTQLGVIGNTGRSRGAHLHFEVQVDGTRVDPIGNGYIVQPK